ncbi:hypothetical protein XU18_5046 [Perkinsela sp. CCAP 1560/4]|nr:hypothetical protein XU18_5046 [Perkinsela sp. CCAP 1560/4]|eukprot:KNH03193.1 hypothetical protein XU18_5046 [Perkinsela sp. CCAP 1560/4]
MTLSIRCMEPLYAMDQLRLNQLCSYSERLVALTRRKDTSPWWVRTSTQPLEGSGNRQITSKGRISLVARRGKTSTNPLFVFNPRDEISPHEKREKQRACAYVSKGTCNFQIAL